MLDRMRKDFSGSAATSPIPINSGLRTVEGLSSPKEPAITPPGVVTKFDIQKIRSATDPALSAQQHRFARIPSTSSVPTAVAILADLSPTTFHPHCICCEYAGKSISSSLLCKNCTTQKLQLMARRGKLDEKLKEKQTLQSTANDLISQKYVYEKEIETTTSTISEFRKLLMKKTLHLMDRKNEVISLKSATARLLKYNDTLKRTLEKVRKSSNTKRENFRAMEDLLRRKTLELSEQRRRFCLPLFYMFGISEVLPHVGDTPLRVQKYSINPSEAWTLLQNFMSQVSPQLRPLYKVRDAVCSLESPSTRSELSNLVIEGAEIRADHRHQLAAFMMSVQLVNLLLNAHDIKLNFLLNLRDICIMKKLTPDLFETDWYKVCYAVAALCRAYNLSTGSVEFSKPLMSLIVLANKMQEGYTMNKMNLSQNSFAARFALENFQWRERTLADWDTLDDASDVESS